MAAKNSGIRRGGSDKMARQHGGGSCGSWRWRLASPSSESGGVGEKKRKSGGVVAAWRKIIEYSAGSERLCSGAGNENGNKPVSAAYQRQPANWWR
jgi:hypothetical protein